MLDGYLVVFGDGRCVVPAPREIDVWNRELFLDELRALTGNRKIIVNLSLVDYMGARAIGLFVKFDKEIAARGGTLQVIAPAGTIARRVLDITHDSHRLNVLDFESPYASTGALG